MDREYKEGVILGLTAHCFWGIVLPLYVAWLAEAGAIEVLAFRIAMGAPVALTYAIAAKQWSSVVRILRDPRARRLIVASTVLIAINWFAFTYAVVYGRLADASFGYYINPLVSVALGCIVLKERLSPLRWIGVGLAAVSAVLLALSMGSVPVIAFSVAISFGFYGLVKKCLRESSISTLTIEFWLLAPAATAAWLYLVATDSSYFVNGLAGGSMRPLGLLLAGVATVIPLCLFNAAANRVPLSTLGVLQYAAPTGQLLLAILLFNEPISTSRLAAFGVLWCAIIIFVVGTVRQRRSTMRDVNSATAPRRAQG